VEGVQSGSKSGGAGAKDAEAGRLTRSDLEQGVARAIYRSTALAARILDDAELEASRRACLRGWSGKTDLWIFAYGSLVWNPLFRYVDCRPAHVHGYHREFCLRSILGRGSPDRPGLVLGLDRGGSCRGVAYRLPAAEVDEDLRLLWRREMVVGSYVPKWLRTDLGGRYVVALAFVVNRAHPQYAGTLPDEELLETMRTASGKWGSSHDYLVRTLAGLRAHGIRDRHLEAIARRLADAAPG
jgi:cation transport protein ChaC